MVCSLPLSVFLSLHFGVLCGLPVIFQLGFNQADVIEGVLITCSGGGPAL